MSRTQTEPMIITMTETQYLKALANLGNLWAGGFCFGMSLELEIAAAFR